MPKDPNKPRPKSTPAPKKVPRPVKIPLRETPQPNTNNPKPSRGGGRPPAKD